MGSSQTEQYVEPWMRATHKNVPAAGRGVLHALELALEDISKWTAGLSDHEVHARPLQISSVAFHLRHIACSVGPDPLLRGGPPIVGRANDSSSERK